MKTKLSLEPESTAPLQDCVEPSVEPNLPLAAETAGGPLFQSYIDHFESAAAQHPDSCALSSAGQWITYRQLDRLAESYLPQLLKAGCGAEDLVAVYMDRSPELVAAMLALMKSAAAFLPLDPQFPTERLKEIIKRSKAKAVLTRPEHAPLFQSCGIEAICIKPCTGPPEQAGLRDRALRRDPLGLAYVIYTSGSTGIPKGVAVCQDSFYRYLRWALGFYSLNPEGISIVHTSIGFDLTLTSLFCPLIAGLRVVLAAEKEGFDGVVRILDEGLESVSLLKLTPSHLGLLPEAREMEEARWDCDVLIVGGEKLTPRHVRYWEGHCRNSRIFNEYGPTEATVGCCVAPVSLSDPAPGGALPIGKAIEGVRLQVFEPSSKPLEESQEGELFVGGPGLARGYRNEPGLTAQRFIPDPGQDGGRLYATGDWVGRTPDGQQLVFVGRKDRQRKIGGVRVELGEIEAAFRKFPGLLDAAVATIPEQDGQEIPIGFLCVADPQKAHVELSQLMSFLEDRLHHAVVPKELYLVERLPLALSGKTDYPRLVRERRGLRRIRDSFLPPRNPIEELLASLWRAVLDHDEEIGIDDSFFALDGNSMKSIQFIYEAERRGLSLTTRDLFELQTIRRLAQLLANADPDRQRPNKAPSGPFCQIGSEDRERLPQGIVDAYPLAMLQAGTLFESDNRIGSGTYHNVNSYHVELALDIPLLGKSIESIVGRHPILRTCYDYVNYSRPLQLVREHVEIPLYVEDISHLSEDEQESLVASFIQSESRNAFDWTKPPLLRFFVHVRGEGRLQFTLSKHHSILDGWSAATLVAEIVKNYFALLKGQPAPFQHPVATTYGDFVALEQQAIRSPEFKRFWRETLKDAPFHALRSWGGAKPDRDCSHSSIITRSVPIPLELGVRLKQVAKSAHAPLKSLLLAVHLRILAQATGARRLVTGVVSHGRPETADADKAIGLFINTIPFHLEIEERSSWLDLVSRVFEEERRVFPYQRYPMARIKKDLGWDRLFDSIFYYTNFHVYRDFRRSEDLKFIDSDGFEETEIPLTVAFHLHPLSAEISLDIHFHVDHFSLPQVDNIVAYARQSLERIAGFPQERALALPSLSQADAAALVCAADPAAPIPEETSVFDLFQQAALRRPDHLALVAGERRLTYAAMDRRSAQLADALSGLGISGERIVGICLRRTSDAIVAMLSVNRAAGCFTVLDPSWPEARLQEVLAQLDPALILCDPQTAPLLQRWPYPTLDLTAPLPAQAAGRGAPRRPSPDELAYVVFTSGSTGQPKGVMVSNGALLRSTRTRLSYYPQRYERFLLLSRLTFDSSLAGLWGTLCGGGALHLIEEDGILDAGQAAELIRDEAITHFLAIPSLYRVLLSRLSASDCPALRTVITAGEELTADLAGAHVGSLGEMPLVNEYGPSEATVWATAAKVAPHAARKEDGVTIGGALDHVETQVLDSGMRPVSLGVAGELYIGGAALARGYFAAPAATASRFLPNPNAQQDRGSTLYRTGDRVRYYPDGRLQFLGRWDNQLKVRGFRIEPEEVERAFRDCFAGCQALVSLREDSPGQKRICLYYEAPDPHSAPSDAREVRSNLSQRLPGYTLPDEVFRVERLPRLPNGKLDRAARPKLLVTPGQPCNGDDDPPSSELERTLADLWREALDLPRIGVSQSFFEIGGDSLLANQVVLRAERVFGAKLLLKEFYQIPTIAAHAQLLKRRGDETGVDFERIASIWNRIE